jgi:hypothetical protein
LDVANYLSRKPIKNMFKYLIVWATQKDKTCRYKYAIFEIYKLYQILSYLCSLQYKDYLQYKEY